MERPLGEASSVSSDKSGSGASHESRLNAADQASRKSAWLSSGRLSVRKLSFLKPRRVKEDKRNEENGPTEDEPKKDKGQFGLSTLFVPPDEAVVADVIFIHGLGGGSIKTWTDSSGPANICWPRDWLPADPEFQHIRIHTFGYDADWRQRTPSILSVHDFAQSLLGDIRNHDQIKKSQTNIILVCHSMGGCVAKKTYILARQDPTCEELAARFHSIFFLATPHRGSELGKALRNLLLVTGVSKPYVKDLVANSGPVLEVNDTFRRIASDLRLWSFFESLPVSDFADILVVDKHSATLGLPNEQVSHMDADHRRICKYAHRTDHNYRRVRNALVSAIDMIKSASSDIIARSILLPYLGTDGSYIDDLAMIKGLKAPGSCVWLTESPDFSAWVSPVSGTPPIFWLLGSPGAGKSIISGHVVESLHRQSKFCSYFFFRRGAGGSQSLKPMLMSLALQMALQDSNILKPIVRLQEEGVSLDGQDRVVWRRLFLETIFNMGSVSSHIWVIDGVDENIDASAVFQILEQAPNELRVFVTSRSSIQVDRGLARLGKSAVVRSMIPNDTCSLVLKELETAWTREDVEEILRQVPDDLNEMYARLLQSIEKHVRQAKLAKSIFTWVTLAIRPLTVDEIDCALRLDLNVSPYQMDRLIIAICGSFIIIDPSGRVHLIHETARQFLLSRGGHSQLGVLPAMGNGRLARLCLLYLNCHLGLDEAASFTGPLLLGYASEYFSQHLLYSDAEESEPFNALCRFLAGCVPHWIELLAQKKNLGAAVRTSIDLVSYTNRAVEGGVCPDSEMESIRHWARDISRASLTFRDPLTKSPAAIHRLIPSFFPAKSVLSQSAALHPPPLSVRSREPTLDECLLCIEHDNLVQIIICGEHHVAIGLCTGLVTVYDMTLLQSTVEMKHPQHGVRRLEFGCADRFIAASGPADVIAIWEVKSGRLLYRLHCGESPTFYFIGHLFMSLDHRGEIEARQLDDEDESFTLHQSGNLYENAKFPQTSIKDCRVDPTNLTRLGLSFVGSGDVYLVDVVESNIAAVFRGPDAVGVRHFCFNSNAEKHLLAVSYTDESLAIFEGHTADLLLREADVFARELSWSSNERYLLSGTKKMSSAVINIYQFCDSIECTLHLVRQIRCPGVPIQDLTFACHGQRIVGSHGLQTRIWEVALTDQLGPARSISEDKELPSSGAAISVMSISMDGQTVFCGTEGGEVVTFSTTCGSKIASLHSGHRSRVNVLELVEWPEVNKVVVITGDEDGVIMATFHGNGPSTRWMEAPAELVERKTESGSTVDNMLVSPTKGRILVQTLSGSEIWTLPNGELVRSLEMPKASARLRAAKPYPLMDDRFVMLEDSRTFVVLWDDDQDKPASEFTLLRHGHIPEPRDAVHFSYLDNERLFVEKLADPVTGVRVNVWDVADFQSLEGSQGTTEVSARRGLQPLSSIIGDIIGLLGSTLVFLDTDRWVCTADLDTFHLNLEIKRHCFIFPAWVGLTGEVMARISPAGDLIFATGVNITILGDWLNISETFLLECFDMDREWEDYKTEDIWVSGRRLR